jgi:hypothetical protein
VTNEGDIEATVHWHGLRLENRYDSVPHDTQAPIPIGGKFSPKVAGIRPSHPRARASSELASCNDDTGVPSGRSTA